MTTGILRGQRHRILELEPQMVLSHPIQVLGAQMQELSITKSSTNPFKDPLNPRRQTTIKVNFY